MTCPFLSPAQPGRRHCGPGGRHAGRRVSPGVCRACMGQPPAKPRTTLAGLVSAHSAKARGCAGCRQQRAAAHAARLAALKASPPASQSGEK